MPGWIAQTLSGTELDLQKGGGYSVESTATLLAGLDEGVRAARGHRALARCGL
jgi:hypothetical protein